MNDPIKQKSKKRFFVDAEYLPVTLENNYSAKKFLK